MKRKTIVLLGSISILLISGLFLYILLNQKEPEESLKAVNGVMDLRSYDFQKENLVELNGEWEFVPNALLDSTELDKSKSQFVQVPSLWTIYEWEGKKVPKYTSGTYRLRILVNDPTQILGIKTTNIRMSNTIYMNGKKIGQSGEPAEDKFYTPHNIPYVVYFLPEKQEIELIVHIANFDYASGGGILGSIYFGNSEAIGKLRESSLAYDWITIASFLTMLVYFLGTYRQLKSAIEQLYFSLFCFANVLYAVSHGEKVIAVFFPAIPYGIFERIQMISTILVGIFVLLYFYYSLKKYAAKWPVQFLCIFGAVLGCVGMMPVYINSSIQWMYTLYMFLILTYIIVIQMIAVYKGAVGAAYLIFSSLTIFVYFVVGTLNVTIDFELSFLPPLFPFICLTMLSLYMSKRFTNSFLQKEELSNALLRVDKLKDEFLAKTSHEFRTPLHGIIAISQTMLDENNTALPREQKEKMSLIAGIAQRLSYLVNDILDFSKLKEGELKIAIAPVDLFAVTHVTVEIFSYMLSKDVKIINHIKRGQYVMADEARLRQVLSNLINNAVKYTEHGTVEIRCEEQEHQVVISISDTGIGIAPENIDKIFEPFQQAENSVEGTGIGLSITKELVKLQRGEIDVHSVVGEGTTFFVTLPKAVPMNKKDIQVDNFANYLRQNPVILEIPYIVENAGQQKIIIADDDHVNLKVLIDVLSLEGYTIIAVDSGKAVLEQLQKHPDADLVILDIMMPEVSGYEICQQLRKSYNLSELPVLMLTAAIHPEDMIAAFQSGANDFLHKPLDVAELKTRIRNLLLMKESAENATKMEVAFLQAQIKPHFIYNVLNSILSLSYLDLDKARTMITDFATFLRVSFSFENTSRLVPLERELSLVQSYVNIHETRFPEQLELEIQKEDSLHCLIPPLFIQPLVENAILHGHSKKVNIVIKEENKIVIFRISDNGIGMSKEQLQVIWSNEESIERGVGLQNTLKRLKYYENASMRIESEENIGTTIEIRFPLIRL